MKALRMDDKGFSITELMFAMTILAIGLLAVAQMQIMAMQGTTVSRRFSGATNLARQATERVKVTGMFIKVGGSNNLNSLLGNDNLDNDADADFAPSIGFDTDITSLKYDMVEVFKENTNTGAYDEVCSLKHYNADCNTEINNDPWDYVRIINIRNYPPNEGDGDAAMKEINSIVLWKDRGKTRSISIRTMVGRKDDDFF